MAQRKSVTVCVRLSQEEGEALSSLQRSLADNARLTRSQVIRKLILEAAAPQATPGEVATDTLAQCSTAIFGWNTEMRVLCSTTNRVQGDPDLGG